MGVDDGDKVPEAAEVGMFSYVNVALGAVFVYLLSKLFSFGQAKPKHAEHHEKSTSFGRTRGKRTTHTEREGRRKNAVLSTLFSSIQKQ
jgi:hypothetical protein